VLAALVSWACLVWGTWLGNRKRERVPSAKLYHPGLSARSSFGAWEFREGTWDAPSRLVFLPFPQPSHQIISKQLSPSRTSPPSKPAIPTTRECFLVEKDRCTPTIQRHPFQPPRQTPCAPAPPFPDRLLPSLGLPVVGIPSSTTDYIGPSAVICLLTDAERGPAYVQRIWTCVIARRPDP
jgi:hypothetical protein